MEVVYNKLVISMKSIINITLNSKSDYLSKYNDKRISRELNDYILEECKSINLDNNLEIHVKTNFEMSDIEKNDLVDMIRENYGIDIREIEMLSKRLFIFNCISVILGIIFLAIYFFSEGIPVISEFILIIGWLLIWEAASNMVFQNIKNRTKIKRRRKLTECKITFDK